MGASWVSTNVSRHTWHLFCSCPWPVRLTIIPIRVIHTRSWWGGSQWLWITAWARSSLGRVRLWLWGLTLSWLREHRVLWHATHRLLLSHMRRVSIVRRSRWRRVLTVGTHGIGTVLLLRHIALIVRGRQMAGWWVLRVDRRQVGRTVGGLRHVAVVRRGHVRVIVRGRLLQRSSPRQALSRVHNQPDVSCLSRRQQTHRMSSSSIQYIASWMDSRWIVDAEQ